MPEYFPKIAQKNQFDLYSLSFYCPQKTQKNSQLFFLRFLRENTKPYYRVTIYKDNLQYSCKKLKADISPERF